MKVIYLSYMRLSEKILRDWYINHLINSGLVVEYWDITNLIRTEVNENFQYSSNILFQFSGLDEFKNAVKKECNAIFISLVPKIWACKNIFKILNYYNCITVSIQWGSVPAFSTKSIIIRLMSYKSFIMIYRKILNRIQIIIMNNLGYIKPDNLTFVAGQALTKTYSKQTKVIQIALCDFDQFVESKHLPRLINKKFAVFLDINLPFQSDLSFIGLQQLIPKKYFSDLNNLFEIIEKKYDFEIVIALHPKSNYDKSEFNNRKIFTNSTPLLVRDAEFVVCHSSTSVSYAVLNQKSLLITYTNEMETLYRNTFMNHIWALAKFLKSPVINASEISDFDEIFITYPNLDCYKKYIKNFIVIDNVISKQSKDIFLNELKLLNVEALT